MIDAEYLTDFEGRRRNVDEVDAIFEHELELCRKEGFEQYVKRMILFNLYQSQETYKGQATIAKKRRKMARESLIVDGPAAVLTRF